MSHSIGPVLGGAVAENVTGDLVQQKDQSQPTAVGFLPVVQFTSPGRFVRAQSVMEVGCGRPRTGPWVTRVATGSPSCAAAFGARGLGASALAATAAEKAINGEKTGNRRQFMVGGMMRSSYSLLQ